MPNRLRHWVDAKRGRSDEDVVQPDVEPEAPAAPDPEPKAIVDERSARALLARGTPPLPEPHKAARRRDQAPPPMPAERDPVVAGPGPQEWNIWELQRAVRAVDDQDRQAEWSALFIHLREFANAEGDLPVEFDELVRESFAGVLESEAAAS